MGALPAGDTRRLILVRHGRTAWNVAKRAQGHTDIPLDDVGHAQAQAMAPLVAAGRPDRLWTSDLLRARQTAAYLEALTGLVAEPDPRLREFSMGERSGLTRQEFAARFPREYAAWLADDDSLQVPGAETTDEVIARIVPALRSYLAALPAGGVGVVVTHGACLRTGLLELLGLPRWVDGVLGSLGNCSWTTVQEMHMGGRLRLTGYNVRVPGVAPDEAGEQIDAPGRSDFATADVVG